MVVPVLQWLQLRCFADYTFKTQGLSGASLTTFSGLRVGPVFHWLMTYPSKRDHAVSFTEPLFHELLCTARSSRRQHAVESFNTSGSVLAFLLVSLQYPSCSIVNEHSVRHATARAEQQVPSHLQRNAHPCPPNGKLGTTSEGFPQYNELGSVRHVCELQGVKTS